MGDNSRRWIKWLGGIVVTAVVGWAVAYFAPGLVREISGDDPVDVHVERDPAVPPADTRTTPKPAKPTTSTQTNPPSTQTNPPQQGVDYEVGSEADPKTFEHGRPNWTEYAYVVPKAIEEIGPPPRGACRNRRGWAYGLGGADAFGTRFQVTLQGKSTGTVVIDDVRVRVTSRQPPLRGSLLRCPVGGADAVYRAVLADLNQDPPDVLYAKRYGVDQPTRTPFQFTLKPGEVEIFYVEAHAERCYCQWVVEFHLIAEGERKIITITDDGRPFRTTGTANARSFAWTGSEWGEWAG